jgi:lipoprotein-anchoring transpeptidase ErfK/SrfK
VSNGCARLLNEHITELYEVVPLNTRVVLYAQGAQLSG